MLTNPKRRASKKKQLTARKESIEWDGARIFVEIARSGSFRSAADALGLSFTAVQRRLDRLERGLDMTLLTRHVDGVRLTAEGEQVLIAAQRMEAASFELMRSQNLDTGAQFGQVKLGVTEGLGTFWITPHLAEYQKRHADISVHLLCGMPSVDVLRLEADLAVQLIRPSAKDLKLVKLGRLHAMPFATKDYISRYGMPKSVADLENHRVVMQIADQIVKVDDFPLDLKTALQKANIPIVANMSSTHYSAVLNGTGLSNLPTYVAAFDKRLVPIDIGVRAEHDIWLVYHPDSGRITRVHQMIDWLVEIFSSKSYPWFGDKFIHPRDLPSLDTGQLSSCMQQIDFASRPPEPQRMREESNMEKPGKPRTRPR
ncbi:MAG TPA: LysR family transcriptional regulator [Rhizomicrobium sp.]